MGLFPKRKVSNGWLAIVPAGRRLDAIRARLSAEGKPVVELAESFEFDGDLLQNLKRLRKPLGLANQRCTTLLVHGQYQLLQTEAPDLAGGPIAEGAEIVRWKIKDMVDFEVTDAAIDLLPIPGEGRVPQVLAAVAPASAVAPVVQGFQAADVPLGAIDLPELSQRNLARLFEDDNRGLATLIFDEIEGLLTFTFRGELYVVRHVEISSTQLSSADDDRRNTLFERIALDVQRSLDNFDRAFSQIPMSKVLVAPVPGAAGFIDYLRANLLLPIEVLDLAEKFDLSAVPALLDPLRQAQCLRALGAALRDEAGA